MALIKSKLLSALFCVLLPRMTGGVKVALAFPLLLTAVQVSASDSKAPVAGSSQQPANTVERVEVVGDTNTLDRRSANMAKQIVTRQDLVRFGDPTLVDVLQRVPGLTVSRTTGKDVEIRMRGLGAGYTQILLDGVVAPIGFSIETISPEQVDRIEILRSSTADLSNQAIAGTINIIFKKPSRQGTRTIKGSYSQYAGQPTANASMDLSGKLESWSWGVTSSVAFLSDVWPATSVNSANSAAGVPLFTRSNSIDERRRLTSFDLSPTVEYRFGGESSLVVSGWLQEYSVNYSNADSRSGIEGDPPQFASDLLTNRAVTRNGRLTVQLKRPLGDDGRFESKVVFTRGRRTSEANLAGLDAAGALLLRRTVDSVADDEGVVATGKLSKPLNERHVLSAGWDSQIEQRSENRVQAESSPVAGYPIQNLDESYSARINRLALFVQDEWAIAPTLSCYLGLRWEGLRTRTEGADISAFTVQSSVVSPIVQFLFKVPETKSDQIRMNFGRSYKPPTARQLIPRRWVVTDNSPTTPNFQGNPNLRPELAWGLDFAYERFLSNGTFAGFSAYARRLDDIVIPLVEQTGTGWLETPRNYGSANVYGLEIESKGKLQNLVANSPNIDFRAGLTRNWSSVDRVPGPGNRLVRQPRFTASLGFDWRASGLPLTLGASFLFEQGTYSRNSPTGATISAYGRKLDSFALWEFSKQSRLRISVSNILAPVNQKQSAYFDNQIVVTNVERVRTFVVARAQFEVSF